MDNDQFNKIYHKIITKARSDDTFKAKLLADPKKIFKKHGLTIPANIKITILENTDSLQHFILPAENDGQLSSEQLNNIFGGRVDGGYCQ